MPIFMNYDGIPGDVESTGHEKWIEISSFQFGVGRGITSATASAADREATTPSVSEIVVTKVTDSASTGLFRASLFGEGKKVTIDFARTNKDQTDVYLTIELENTLVSGYSASSGGDRPSESVSLNFTKITYKNTAAKAGLDSDNPDIAEYDLSTQSGS